MKKKAIISCLITVTALSALYFHKQIEPINLDKSTLIFLIIACLPWLGYLLKSIEITGIGKAEFRELKEKITEVSEQATNAERMSEFVNYKSSEKIVEQNKLDSLRSELNQLGQEYNQIRSSQPSGSVRTSNMTRIVKRMVDISNTLNFNEDEIQIFLDSKNMGERLIGYSYLFTNPEFSFIIPLVNSITNMENKPFGQYWGLQALHKIVNQRTDQSFPSNIIGQLNDFSNRYNIKPGTDRNYMLGKINAALKS